MFANDRQMSNALDRWLTTEPAWRTEEDEERHPDYEFVDEYEVCPVCAERIDYCQGHGEIGDPVGFAILAKHDADDHSECHPSGCEEAYYLAHPHLREG